MPIFISEYSLEMIGKVKEFNSRIKKKGFIFPENNESFWLPRSRSDTLCETFYLAVEDNCNVRGGYVVKTQPHFCNNKIHSINCYYAPVSEGIISPRYGLLGISLICDALKRNPLLYIQGIGGIHTPFAQMIMKLKWEIYKIPFYFFVLDNNNFNKNICFLKKKSRYFLFKSLGINWGLKLYNYCKTKVNLDLSFEVCSDFSEWANEIWEKSFHNYSFVGEKDSTTLNLIFSKKYKKITILKILEKNVIIGWCVVSLTKMNNNTFFNNMYVGAIIDCFSLPNKENNLVTAVLSFFKLEKVDVIVTNQSNLFWRKALIYNGFIRGLTNQLTAFSPQLSKLINMNKCSYLKTHINRGSGEPEYNL